MAASTEPMSDCVSFWIPRSVDVKTIAGIARSVTPNPTVLEIGCGNAFGAHLLARELPVTAVDPNTKLLEQTPYRHPDLTLLTGTAEDCIELFRDKSVDVVVSAWMPQGINLSESIYRLNPKAVIFIRDGLEMTGVREAYEPRENYQRIVQWLGFTKGDINSFFNEICRQLEPYKPMRYYSVLEAVSHPRWKRIYGEQIGSIPSMGLNLYNIFDVRFRSDVQPPQFPIEIGGLSPYPWETQLNHLTNNRFVKKLYGFESVHPPVKIS